MSNNTRQKPNSKPIQVQIVRAYWDLFFRLISFAEPSPLYMMIRRVALRDICHTGGSWMAEEFDALNPPLVDREKQWIDMGNQIRECMGKARLAL